MLKLGVPASPVPTDLKVRVDDKKEEADTKVVYQHCSLPGAREKASPESCAPAEENDSRDLEFKLPQIPRWLDA